jgi:hypothetical protein
MTSVVAAGGVGEFAGGSLLAQPRAPIEMPAIAAAIKLLVILMFILGWLVATLASLSRWSAFVETYALRRCRLRPTLHFDVAMSTPSPVSKGAKSIRQRHRSTSSLDGAPCGSVIGRCARKPRARQGVRGR